MTMTSRKLTPITLFALASIFSSSAALAVNYADWQQMDSRSRAEHVVELIDKNQVSELQALINQGFDPNQVLDGDGSALIVAIRSDNIQMVRDLIKAGADVNQAVHRDGNPLITAAIKNNIDVAELLFVHGADVNAVVIDDETALINAAHHGHMEMVRYLVENGADVNLGVDARTIRGSEYRTPLNRAANDEIRQYLIAAGAQG